jgi:hypothetical protein
VPQEALEFSLSADGVKSKVAALSLRERALSFRPFSMTFHFQLLSKVLDFLHYGCKVLAIRNILSLGQMPVSLLVERGRHSHFHNPFVAIALTDTLKDR